MDAFYCCSSFPIFDFNDFEIIELKSIFGMVGECDGYRQTLQTCNDDNFFSQIGCFSSSFLFISGDNAASSFLGITEICRHESFLSSRLLMWILIPSFGV